jgi:hypothetical protein
MKKPLSTIIIFIFLIFINIISNVYLYSKIISKDIYYKEEINNLKIENKTKDSYYKEKINNLKIENKKSLDDYIFQKNKECMKYNNIENS